MKAKNKIVITDPCEQDWNAMIPDETGRFCNICTKSVIDFTKMPSANIQDFFIKNHGQKICGRFKNDQLESIVIQIPNQILFSQIHYHKIFLLALFICMGTTLFSCKQENGNNKKIDKIQILEDPSVTEKISVEVIKKNTKKSEKMFQTSKIKKIKYVKKYSKNSIHINDFVEGFSTSNPPKEIDMYEDNYINGLISLDSYPEFPGGNLKFKKNIIDNFTISKNARKINGIIIANFLIRKDGSLDSASVSKDLGFGTKEQLLKILRKSPKWIPGELNGKHTDCEFQLSLHIKLDTIKKSFFGLNIQSKIDSIEMRRITIY